MNHKPATELPWFHKPFKGSLSTKIYSDPDQSWIATVGDNGEFIVHACNAYPRLVEALRMVDQADGGPWGREEQWQYAEQALANLRALLSELGEAA